MERNPKNPGTMKAITSKKYGFSKKMPPSQRKAERRRLARKQIEALLDLAVAEGSMDPELSARHAEIAWEVSTRFNIRLKERRQLFCRFCKSFLGLPGKARYRLSKKRKILNITCISCGRTYHKMLRSSLKRISPTING